MVGRRPVPTALKRLTGNPGHRPLNKCEPTPAPGRPSCPAWLLPEAKREWRRLTPVLERLGLLTALDRAGLAVYCQAVARFVAAEAAGDARASRTYERLLRSYLTEFGLTPATRRYLVVSSGCHDDPLAALDGR